MTDSDNVELKKRSRRRLVGAGALALLAAIVLPMVMDQEPSSPAQDIQVTIPDREADSALSRPIGARAGRAPEPQLSPPPDEQGPAAPPDAPRPEASSANSGTSVPASPAVVPKASQPVAPPPEASRPPAPGKDAVPDAARAQAILEGKTPTAAASPAAGGEAFIVQIGAFGDAAKAASIATDLKKRGFAAYTERAGPMTRVRLGPFGGREEAEKVARRVRASGLNGSVLPR